MSCLTTSMASVPVVVSQLLMDINESFLNKQHLIAAFLEIEAAYPSVHLPTLSTIMSQLGLLSHFHKYITSMFINQNISISSSTHNLHRKVYRGLPQGFPLSPTLYNRYSLNLIPHHTSETKAIVFADDIIVYSSHADLAFAAYRTQCAINELINNASSTFNPPPPNHPPLSSHSAHAIPSTQHWLATTIQSP